MKKTRYSEAQIMGILRQAESGVAVSELCREHGMSSASFYKWRSKFGGMDASMMSEMKALAEENRRLKRMYAEMSMQNDLLKEVLGKSRKAFPAQGDGCDGSGASWCQHCVGLPFGDGGYASPKVLLRVPYMKRVKGVLRGVPCCLCILIPPIHNVSVAPDQLHAKQGVVQRRSTKVTYVPYSRPELC